MFEIFNSDDHLERDSLLSNLLIHDLNQILQNIRTSSELTDLYINDPKLKHKVKGLLGTIKQQTARGFRLISNVHKLSQLEKDQLNLHKIEVCELLETAINFVKTPLQDNVNFNINAPFTEYYVNANSLLQDVFENLLINAVVHNKNEIIKISIKVSELNRGKKKYLKMEFMDNGVGIDDVKKKNLFKLKTINLNNGKSMGFGLFLVKNLVDSYKGKIWVEDKVKGNFSKGSNFILLIPKAK
ncbi:MAG: HAMP domain-containing histidine kinase [Candidatus Lokiarchaeota archaeon]|nr:HAMP domain-containing histidine kinase [Candidatus Lokiarchaeota archaeon]